MRVFSLVTLILGGFIGAGFASGREIANYFSEYKFYSNISIVLSSIVLFFLLILFLFISNKFNNFKSLIDSYFGKFAWLINVLFALVLLVLIGAMFAGTVAIADSLKISNLLVLIFTVFIAYIVSLGNLKMIDKLNKCLVPFMLVIIVYICLGKNTQNFSVEKDVVLSVVSGINYMFINIATLGMFLLEIGRNYTKKDKIVASFIVSVIICIVLLIFNNAIISCDLIYDIMPIISLSKSYNNFIQILIKITIWIALFTTLISNVFILSNFTKIFIKNKYLNLSIILMLGLLIGMCGFDVLVNYIYAFIGVVGFIVILNILIKEKETKIIVSSFKKK